MLRWPIAAFALCGPFLISLVAGGVRREYFPVLFLGCSMCLSFSLCLRLYSCFDVIPLLLGGYCFDCSFSRLILHVFSCIKGAGVKVRGFL